MIVSVIGFLRGSCCVSRILSWAHLSWPQYGIVDCVDGNILPCLQNISLFSLLRFTSFHMTWWGIISFSIFVLEPYNNHPHESMGKVHLLLMLTTSLPLLTWYSVAVHCGHFSMDGLIAKCLSILESFICCHSEPVISWLASLVEPDNCLVVLPSGHCIIDGHQWLPLGVMHPTEYCCLNPLYSILASY